NGLVNVPIDSDAESRQDLNKTPISGGIVAKIRKGLQGLADWSAKLAQVAELANNLPGLGMNLAQTLAIGDGSAPIGGVLQHALVDPINDYFNTHSAPNVQELVDLLKSLSQPMGKVRFGVDPFFVTGGLYTNPDGNQELRLDLAVHLAGLAAQLPV